MVVDDSAVIRKVASRILNGLGFETIEFDDSREALARCQGGDMPTAVLVDSGLDGFGFVRALRKLPGGLDPRVLVCTSYNDLAQTARARHAGADDCLMKPFEAAHIRQSLQALGLLAPDEAPSRP